MASKLVVVLALAAVGQCSYGPVGRVDDYSSFSYQVGDPYTGDYKNQVENRSGGNVQGQYSLLESDGTKRTVDYAADDINGFNAVVRKDPAVIAAAPALAAVPPAIVSTRNYDAPAVYIPGLGRGIPSLASHTTQNFATPSVNNGPSVDYSPLYSAPAIYSGGLPFSSSPLCHAQPSYCH